MNDNYVHKALLEQIAKEASLVPQKDNEKQANAEKNYQEDYETTREAVKNLVRQGELAIREFMDIALETREPSAFKVLAELLNTTGNLATKVIDNAKAKSEIDNNLTGGAPRIGTQNNAVFLGSPQELLEQIKEQEDSAKTIEAEIIDNDNKPETVPEQT